MQWFGQPKQGFVFDYAEDMSICPREDPEKERCFM